MAENSWWWTTDGTGDGTNTGYTQAEVAQFYRYLFTSDPTTQCVVPGVLNELAPAGVASPVTIDTGYGICDGMAYKNDASLNVAVATPVVGTTGHRVVLEAKWGATQEVRVALLSSADGTPDIPSCTQTSGTEYEVSLATLTITTGGTITLTDDRGYCEFSSDEPDMMIIPIWSDAEYCYSSSSTYADPTAQADVDSVLSDVVFDSDKLPKNATVKLCARFRVHPSGTAYVELYNKTDAGDVANSVVSTSDTTYGLHTGSDMRNDLASGTKTYNIRLKVATAGTTGCYIVAAWLLVEW